MVFNAPGHIDMIRSGTKTQTRRVNRGIYRIGKDYAVQRKRGVKAESDIRIIIKRIWEEIPPITGIDANCEGGYISFSYEAAFRKVCPKWDGCVRWAFKFAVIEVQRD